MIWPPTPTPLPDGAPLINIPSDSFSLWGGADYAIQSWQLLPDATTYVIQGVILIAVIIAGMYILFRWFKEFTQRDAES